MKTNPKAILAALLLAGAFAGSASAQMSGSPQCDDGTDNDGDGLVDYNPVSGGDLGCDAWNDTSEAGTEVIGQIKPRLAILFDTSGSMTWYTNNNNYTGGDGSIDCPGDGNARSKKVKVGTFDAIAAYGELEYSLYRFRQTRQGSFTCSASYQSGGPIGRWRGAQSSNNECNNNGADYNHADRLVRFGPENQRWILQWMDEYTNYTNRDYELRASGFTPIAGSLADIHTQLVAARNADAASACRPYRVVVVTDGEETCDNDGTDGAAAAAESLHNDLYDANKPNSGFSVYVIGFASASLEDEMNQIAAAGGTTEAYLADDPDELSNALAQIVDELVLVEKCNHLDDDCDGVTDNGFTFGPCNNGQLGACYREGIIDCVSDSETACNAPHITPGSEMTNGCNGVDDDCDGLIDDGLQCQGCGVEICNGRDDDCDMMVDEGTLPGEGAPCGTDVGACVAGHYDCSGGKLVCTGQTGPTPEICDSKDNNCDGVTDQITRSCWDFPSAAGCTKTGSTYTCKGVCRPGTQTCTSGTYNDCAGDVGPGTEICNGLDDDCDGTVDEGFENVGKTCEVGMGLCKTVGHYVCSNGGMICDAQVITGTPEVCNGVDDDCDGIIDNLPVPPPPPIGEPCGTCGGVYICKNGLSCSGGAANPEVCNGLDDDCNNIVDDGVLPGVGDSCVPTKDGVPLFEVKGECKAGHKECIAAGLTCVGYLGPLPEVCDGKDNDCDGVLDDMAACPSAADACYQTQCVSPCMSGEFPCPFGQYCKDLTEGRFCVPNPCNGKVCPEGQVCDPETVECKDPCASVTCPTGAQCRNGRCFDCFTLGCAEGLTCVAGPNQVGVCQADACLNVTCGERQTCEGGSCVPVACNPVGGCSADQRCENEVCVPRCAADICFGTACNEGFVCNPASGRCIADPCERTNCGGTECTLSCEGKATCTPSKGIDVLATGSGGGKLKCAVAVGGSQGAPSALLLFAGLALLVRRRKRSS